MKSVKKIEENGIYLILGKAVAKNAFFESRKDIEFAHRYIMRYLHGMMDIQDYLFTPDGWILIVKTKSATRIVEAYLKFRNNSKKAKEQSIKTSPSEMLSEHIRFYLSALVKAMNRQNLRTGTKVHRVFERFIFESYEEYEESMKSMRAEALGLCNQRQKYKSQQLDYKELQKIVGQGNVVLCSKEGNESINGETRMESIIDLQRFTNDVLRKCITKTITHNHIHSTSLKPPNTR